MAALDATELEEVFEILSLSGTYKKFMEEDGISTYDSECESLETESKNVKHLCKIFLKNIQNLPNFQNGSNKHNEEASYLAYWVIDKLSEILPNNSEKGDRNTIINFIGKGNDKYFKLNKKHLFSNSDFDYERSREEKYLNEYFKNCDKIEACSADKYKTCEKYLTYIIRIYEEHKKDCLGNECHYFSHNPKYDPNDLLFKLKNKFRATDAKENVVLAENNRQSLDANNSRQNRKMIIKYMSCTEIKDEKDNVYAYKCEDPAYRRHRERVYRRGNLKREVISSDPVSNVIEKINGLTCKKATINNNNMLFCNNSKTDVALDKLDSITNTGTRVANGTQHVYAKHSYGIYGEDAYKNIGKNNHLDSNNLYPGVKLLSSNRNVSEFKYENTETQTNSKGKYDFLTTVYHEFKKEDLNDYFEKPKDICSNSSSNKDNTNCVKVAQTYNSQEIRQGDSTIYSDGTEFMNMGFADFFGDKLNLLKSNNVRIAVLGFLIAGAIFIFFLYFKFTPFGFWLRKKVLKEKRTNNITYDEHMMNYPVHNSQPKHVNHNRKRIKIAYQAN